MTRPSLVLYVALAAIASAFAAEPATTPTRTTATTTTIRPAAPKSRLASRLLLIQPGNFNFSNDDFYIAAKQRELPKLAAAADGEDQLGNWLTAQSVNSQDQFQIIVSLPPAAPPIAAEIADDLVDFFRTYLAREYEESRKQSLERDQRDFDINQRRADVINQELNRMRERLRDLSGRSDVSPKTLTAALSTMDDELQHLRIDRLAKDARRSALEEQIAQLTERVAKRIETDPIAAELQKVVDAREETAKNLKMMHEQGSASRAEFQQAVAQAAEAKAKLLQQQRDSAAAAGGTSLEAFNRELMNLSIDAKEMDIKTKYLEDRLPKLRQAVELLDDYTRIEQRAKDADSSLDIVTRHLEDARAVHEQANPPKVLIKESKNERDE